MFANKINHILKKNNWLIPEELRVSRLLILTKTSTPVASVSQTRPIAVQSLPIRIIEKIIKQNLDNCQLCKSTELPIYQTGFQPNMSTMINLIRVKSVINKNRKRSKNKKFIFFLDLTKAFDTIERSYIISAIHNIIKTKTNCWEKCWTLWAFTIQLIKIRSAYYGDSKIEIKRGVPQGGVLSPLLFTLALDFILSKNQIWRWMIRTGRLIAYADDLAITVSKDEVQHVLSLIEHLRKYSLQTNTSKCQYLGPIENNILNKVGEYKNTVKYLGWVISYHKSETIKHYKLALKKNISKWRYIKRMLTPQQYEYIMNVFYKSVLLYQSFSGYIAGELSSKNIQDVDNMMIRKLLNVPPGVSTALARAISPYPNNWVWFANIAKRQIDKLKNCPRINKEINPNLIISINQQNWELFDKNEISLIENLWCPQISYTVLQVTANQFEWDISKEPWIWLCGEYFTKNHRINWDKIFSADMRLFSPEFFVTWLNKDKPKQIELLKSKYLATKGKLRLMKTKASKTKTI